MRGGVVRRIIAGLGSVIVLAGGINVPTVGLSAETDGSLAHRLVALLTGADVDPLAAAGADVVPVESGDDAVERDRHEARQRREARERREARQRREAEDRRATVRRAQQRLADLGYHEGAVDGIAGPRTTTAVRSFQKVVGLPVDGVLDARTTQSLLADDAPVKPDEVAPRRTASPSPCDYRCRGQRLWSSLPVSAPPGWTVAFEPGRSGYLGMTYPSSRRIVIWMRDSKSDGFMSHVMLHEIGHAVDVDHLPDSEQSQWMSHRGLSGAWYDCPQGGCGDLATPAGDWAEAYGWCHGSGVFESQIGRTPTDSECSALRRLAR